MSILNYLVPVNWNGEKVNYELALLGSLSIIGDFNSYDGVFIFDDDESLNDGIEKIENEDITVLSVDFDERVIEVDKKSLPDAVELPNKLIVDKESNYMEVYPEDLRGEISYIGYTGRYPNLCYGILWLKVGDDLLGLNGIISNCGYWRVYKKALPENLKGRVEEIEEIINKNLSTECCGGCL